MAPPKPYPPSSTYPDMTGSGSSTLLLQEAGDEMLWFETWRNDYTIVSASNTTPIVITTSESIAGKILTGNSVAVQGVSGSSTANGVWSSVTVTGTHTFSLDGSTAGGAGTGGRVYEASLGAFGKIIDALEFLRQALGFTAGDQVGDPLGSVTFGALSIVTFDGANIFSGTSATQVQSGGSFQVNSGATLTSASATGVRLTGTQPAKTADPGANNIAVSTNQCKAWGNIAVGSGVTLNDGYNTSGVSTSGNNVVVAFARSMANADYAVTFGVEMLDTEVTSSGMVPQPFVNLTGAVKTAAGFSFKLWNANGGSIINPASASSLVVNYTVLARQ